MDNYGRFALLYGRTQLNIVKILKKQAQKKTDQWLPGNGSGMEKSGKEGVQRAQGICKG